MKPAETSDKLDVKIYLYIMVTPTEISLIKKPLRKAWIIKEEYQKQSQQDIKPLDDTHRKKACLIADPKKRTLDFIPNLKGFVEEHLEIFNRIIKINLDGKNEAFTFKYSGGMEQLAKDIVEIAKTIKKDQDLDIKTNQERLKKLCDLKKVTGLDSYEGGTKQLVQDLIKLAKELAKKDSNTFKKQYTHVIKQIFGKENIEFRNIKDLTILTEQVLEKMIRRQETEDIDLSLKEDLKPNDQGNYMERIYIALDTFQKLYELNENPPVKKTVEVKNKTPKEVKNIAWLKSQLELASDVKEAISKIKEFTPEFNKFNVLGWGEQPQINNLDQYSDIEKAAELLRDLALIFNFLSEKITAPKIFKELFEFGDVKKLCYVKWDTLYRVEKKYKSKQKIQYSELKTFAELFNKFNTLAPNSALKRDNLLDINELIETSGKNTFAYDIKKAIEFIKILFGDNFTSTELQRENNIRKISSVQSSS